MYLFLHNLVVFLVVPLNSTSTSTHAQGGVQAHVGVCLRDLEWPGFQSFGSVYSHKQEMLTLNKQHTHVDPGVFETRPSIL